MRLFGILALLLALASVVHAQNASAVITPYLLPGETYSLDSFSLNGGNYTLVSVGNKPYFLLEQAGEEYVHVEDVGRVQSLLTQKRLATIDVDVRISNLSMHLLNFNASRGKERLCKQYTGLIITHEGNPDEERPCFFNSTSPEVVKLCLNGSQDLPHETCAPPIQSCLVACRTVPICFTALANNLPAIYEIYYFKKSINEMDAGVSALLAELPSVRTLESAEMNESAGLLANIRIARNNADNNGLFSSYDFCENVVYNLTALDSAGAILDGMNADVRYIDSLGGVAAEIVRITADRKKLSDKSHAYDALIANATARMNAERQKMSAAAGLLNDQFARSTHNTAEYSFYQFTSAVAAKDYLSADIAYQDFTIAIENADNAAENLVQRYGKLHGLLENCTQSVYRAEQLDEDEQYLGSTTRLLSQLADERYALNATPIETTTFVQLEARVKGTCIDVGDMLGKLGGDFFGGKREKIDANLAEARNASLSYAGTLNDTEVLELLAQANASSSIGNFDRTAELYDQALEKSAALLAFEKAKAQTFAEAVAEIEKVDGKIKDAQGSWKFAFVRPETGIANATLTEARFVLHDDPAKALELAQNANAEIDAASGAVAVVNYGIVGGVMMFIFAMGLLAVGLVFMKRMKKR
ncbi:MAG: hypothetical protein WC759_00570 [Candidatus Micrarchaeia archaeon]|jgi:hypothetical protein